MTGVSRSSPRETAPPEPLSVTPVTPTHLRAGSGATSAALTANIVADHLGLDPDFVYLASTGVIGEPLPDDALRRGLPILADAVVASSPDGWEAAANAIRTTDTFAKGSARRINGAVSHIVGIAKGSGMIAPDMATMLAFVFTDLPVEPNAAANVFIAGGGQELQPHHC